MPVTELGRVLLASVARDFQSLRHLRDALAGADQDATEPDLVAELMELEECGLIEAYGNNDALNSFVRVPVHLESEFESLWFSISEKGREALTG